MIVVDASVAVKWFVEEEGHQFALSLLEQHLVIIAPDLIFSETTNVLWKKLRRGEVTRERDNARRVLADGPPKHMGYIISLLGYVPGGMLKISDLSNRNQGRANPNSKPEA